MSEALITLIIYTALAFVPILYVADYLKDIRTRSLGRFPGFTRDLLRMLVPGLFLFSVIHSVNAAVETTEFGEKVFDKPIIWIACTFFSILFYFRLQKRAISSLVGRLPEMSGDPAGNASSYLYCLSLGAYSGVFFGDLYTFLHLLRCLAGATIGWAPMLNQLDFLDHSIVDALFYPLVSCLWLKFLTLTAFSTFEEVGCRAKVKPVSLFIFMAVMLLCLLFSFDVFIVGSTLFLAMGNFLMLCRYRRVRTLDRDARRGAAGGDPRRLS